MAHLKISVGAICPHHTLLLRQVAPFLSFVIWIPSPHPVPFTLTLGRRKNVLGYTMSPAHVGDFRAEG